MPWHPMQAQTIICSYSPHPEESWKLLQCLSVQGGRNQLWWGTFQDVSKNGGNRNQGASALSVNKLTQECIFDSCSTFYFLFPYPILVPVSKSPHQKNPTPTTHTHKKAAAFKITEICHTSANSFSDGNLLYCFPHGVWLHFLGKECYSP